MALVHKKSSEKIEINEKWDTLPKDWFKLHTDGSSLGNHAAARAGCLFRDENGKFIMAIATPIAFSSAFLAKAIALKMGIKATKALNLTNVMVETDCRMLHEFVTKNSYQIPAIAIDNGNSRNCECRKLCAEMEQEKQIIGLMHWRILRLIRQNRWTRKHA
ncbi:hypothetical protein IFM89_033451 [Coptis chinensis]|uniref:RNase H type-1 domain-containing protein n=1 Tax=Coptis chinensis TaxID=261450 RepID=A0A835HY11_9MAGN|nr:hypothetical protein IFM89_033451 [Coptis chinensis]